MSGDWRDGASYAQLLCAERSAFAWEWLRRQPDYRVAALRNSGFSGHAGAAAWGLHRFEDPDIGVPLARPLWRADRLRRFLRATAIASEADEDSFVLGRFGTLATICSDEAGEHLLLSDGWRSLRLDLAGASVRDGPVRLSYDIRGFAAAGKPLLALRQLMALAATGSLSPHLHPPDRRAHRQILLLRAFDALAAGVGQRAIAAALLGNCANEERWRIEAPSLRSQVQRLVRASRLMAAGGFWSLLD